MASQSIGSIFKHRIAFAFLLAASCGVQAQLPHGKRVFTFEDALKRSEIEAAVVSPGGASVAVQVTRALAEPGVHAGASRLGVQPRGDIWLFDANLADAHKLPADNLWTWAPAYSPSGQKLAALRSDPDGRVGIIVWDLATRNPVSWTNVEIDVHAALSVHGVPDLNQSGRTQRTRPFVWVDDQTVLFVDRNGVLQQYGLAPATAAATYSALRERTRSGQLSVRVWNEKSPTEGAANRLMTLDVTTGATVVHYEGDVRGVSLSPDRSHAALLMATHHLKPTDAAMDAPLRSIHLYDDRVAIALVVQSLGTASAGKPVQGVRLAGPVAPSRLPLWSDDGRRIGLAGRGSYTGRATSGDDVAWEVHVDTLKARQLPARSALDAELIANLLAGEGLRTDEAIRRRPEPVSAKDLVSLGWIPGRVWRFAADRYLIWSDRQVQVLSPQGIVLLPGEFDFAYAVDTDAEDPRFILFRGEQHFDLRFNDHEPVLAVLDKPLHAEILAAKGSGGLTLYKRDGEAGTSLHLLRSGKPALSVTPFNRHMSEVATPPVRELQLEIGGRRLTGTLRLPPDRRASDRHPVVVWAYPGSLPAANSRSHRVNSGSSRHHPFQYLLGKGFAVFFAPFPVEEGIHPDGPLQMAADAVTPWLELLDRQPEILEGEYAFWGHSNAGYVGLALAAKTNAFKAIAVSSTFPDLHWTLDAGLEFSALDSAGEIMQVRRVVYEHEAQPYTLGAPPWSAQDQWVRNSPVFNLDQATTPMLLLVGEFDFGTSRPMERVYSILRGRGVPAEMAQYWGEAHVITSPENLLDTWTRTERFFRKHLRMY